LAVTQQFSAGENLTAAKLNTSSIPVVSATSDITTPFTGQLVYNTTTGCLHRYTGSAWVLYDGNTQWAFKTATESVTSSTTLQNDDHISFSVASSGTYALRGFLYYDGAADIAGGLKMFWTGPASSTLNWANFGPNQGSLSSYNVVIETLASSPRSVGTNATTGMSLQPTGVFTSGGSAGTLQFQWAQQTSNATATRILVGSWMSLTRMA